MDNTTLQRFGRQRPNREIVPTQGSSLFDDPAVMKMVNSWGFKHVLPWQEYVLRNALMIDDNDDTMMAHNNVGLTCMRQVGKSFIIEILIILFLVIFPRQQLYTSYNKDSSSKIFKRLYDKIYASKMLSKFFPEHLQTPREGKNELILQAIDPKTGRRLGRCEFITRKGGAGRGSTYDVVYYDEAQGLTSEELAALSPTATQGLGGGQEYYFGTPVSVKSSATMGKHSDEPTAGAKFLEMRSSILEGRQTRSAWMEWGVDHVPEKTNKNIWYEVIPVLGYSKLVKGINLTEINLEADLSSNEEFAVERLGYWHSQGKDKAINPDLWSKGFVDKINKNFEQTPAISLALKSDVNEKHIFAVVGIKVSEELKYVDLTRMFDLTEINWEIEFWAWFEKYVNNRGVKSIIIDGSAAKTFVTQILARNGEWNSNKTLSRQGKIKLASTGEVADSTRTMLSDINMNRVKHIRQPLLDAAVNDAALRKLSRNYAGDGFKSLTGMAEVAPLEAAAMALYALSDISIEEVRKDAGVSLADKFARLNR